MNVLTSVRPGVNVWDIWQTDDARFKRYTRNSVLAFMLVGLVIPWLPVIKPERLEPVKVPERIARMVLEQKPPAPPRQAAPVQPERPVEAKKQPKKTDKPKPAKTQTVKPRRQTVREKVSKVGLLALSQELAEIQQLTASNLVSKTGKLKRAEKARRVTRSAPDKSRLTQASKGASADRSSVSTSNTRLNDRALSKLELPVAVGSQQDRKGKNNARARTLEDISRVLQRSKSSFYILYNRELRKNPGIKGRVLMEIKIAPEGHVVSCRILESELNSPALERRLVLKIKSLNFGERDVDTTLINYPLEFSPA